MSKLPSIGIVTPSFNQGSYIQRTIDSVLKQDYPVQQYEIIDGGSCDQTKHILSSFSDKLSWISEKDDGQADAVNKGWSKLKTDIIGWINSDDIYMPGTFQKVAMLFKQNPDISVVYGLAEHIDENDKFMNYYPTLDWETGKLKNSCYICQPTVFIKREVIFEAGYLNKALQYCMDYEYWIRLEQKGYKFKLISEVLAGSRMYDKNKTMSKKQEVHKEIVNMLKMRYGKVETRWIKALSTSIIEDGLNTKNNSYQVQILSALMSLMLERQYNKSICYGFYFKSFGKYLANYIKSI